MNKKKKKKMNKRKKRIIIISVLIILLIIFLAVLRARKNNEITSADQANSLKSIVEFCECKYISSKESSLDGYSVDVYLEFKYNTYDDNDSKKLYYDNTAQGIDKFLKYKKIRLIDESKGLTVKVEGDGDKIKNIYINDVEETEYFNKLLSEKAIKDSKELNETGFNLNSILNTLAKNEWNTKNVNFGNKTSTFDNYDIYFDNGYRIRTINNKIFNIVFTKKFETEVINNIKVGTSLEDVKKTLGNNYKESNEQILEYLGKDVYVCFSENEISVYPRIQYDYSQFEDLVKAYSDGEQFTTFMDKLTDIWPDYSSYDYGDSYCEICYPLKGVKISNSSQKMDGIQIYQEYQGDLKEGNKEYKQLYYKTDESLILEQEEKRLMQKAETVNATDGSYNSSKYCASADIDSNKKVHNIKIFSIDSENADSELDKNIYASAMYWYDDENLIYSIENKGIYIYNATTRTTKTIVSGGDKFEITNFDNNNKILTYDGKDAKIQI